MHSALNTDKENAAHNLDLHRSRITTTQQKSGPFIDSASNTAPRQQEQLQNQRKPSFGRTANNGFVTQQHFQDGEGSFLQKPRPHEQAKIRFDDCANENDEPVSSPSYPLRPNFMGQQPQRFTTKVPLSMQQGRKQVSSFSFAEEHQQSRACEDAQQSIWPQNSVAHTLQNTAYYPQQDPISPSNKARQESVRADFFSSSSKKKQPLSPLSRKTNQRSQVRFEATPHELEPMLRKVEMGITTNRNNQFTTPEATPFDRPMNMKLSPPRQIKTEQQVYAQQRIQKVRVASFNPTNHEEEKHSVIGQAHQDSPTSSFTHQFHKNNIQGDNQATLARQQNNLPSPAANRTDYLLVQKPIIGKCRTQGKRTNREYQSMLITREEDAQSLQTDKTADKRVGLIANFIINKIKESQKILFPDLKNHVDQQFPDNKTMQRRTYDVVNILKVIGVVKEYIDVDRRKFLTYDPSMLEGAQAAEVQKQEANEREKEIDFDLTKERIEQKLRIFRSKIRQTVELGRLIERNKKFNSKPSGDQPDFKLQVPLMVVQLAPETHTQAVIERHENLARASIFCSKPPSIWDTERIISRLQLQSVQDESSSNEIVVALGESFGHRVLELNQKVTERDSDFMKMLQERSMPYKELLEQRKLESRSPSPVKMRSALKSAMKKSNRKSAAKRQSSKKD